MPLVITNANVLARFFFLLLLLPSISLAPLFTKSRIFFSYTQSTFYVNIGTPILPYIIKG